MTRALPLGVALALALAGACRGTVPPAALSLVPAGSALEGQGCPGGDGRVFTEADLGLSLSPTAAGLPRELEALAALVASKGADPLGAAASLTVEAAATAAEPSALVGAPGCRSLATERAVMLPEGERLSLVPAGGAAAGKRQEAEQHLREGRFPEARAALHQAAAHEAAVVPETSLAVGDTYLMEERFEEARAVFAEVTGQWPAVAQGWVGLANAERRLDHRLDAVAAAGRAASLWPERLVQIPWLRGDPFVELHPSLSPPAVRAETEGGPRWRQLPAPGIQADDPQARAEALAYAACKESFRRSPELRRAATGRDLPEWRWTPAEESVCTLMWLRAYLGHRALGRAAVEGLDEVADIAQRGLLDERSLYDVALAADVRVPLLLPAARRAQLQAFVARYRVVPRKDSGWLFP